MKLIELLTAIGTNVTDVSMNEIGKTLFFTHEEAEKKLEEMKK